MTPPSPRTLPPALRRRNLLVGGIAGLAVAAATAESAWTLREASEDTAPPASPGDGPVHMQIVAHPDDCLYFINPRIARVLDTGVGSCTVVLTAGEADGRNTWGSNAPSDYAGYAASRNTGLRRAYALLATGDADSVWDRRLADLDSGQHVELCVLRERPEIHVIFCSLWTNLGRITGEFTRLLALWEGRLDTSLVLPPTDSPLAAETLVDRATVQATLLELLDRYRPSVVNTLDPDPDPVVGESLGAEQSGYSDHIDHTAAALFAWEAVREWGRAAAVESWRGYYNRRWPANLGDADLETKGRAVDAYAWADGADCGDPIGCGDRLIVGPGAGRTYGPATHPRYSPALASAEFDGRIRPIAVRGTRIEALGDTGWEDLGGPDALPSLARAGTRLFAVSPRHTHDPATHARDLHCLDLETGQWQELGNPVGEGEEARIIGQVTAADNGRSALAAVRAPGGGLHVLSRPVGGPWSEWTHLDGPAVHEAPAAIATTGGAFTIMAATPDNVAAWEGDGREWAVRDLDLPGADGATAHIPASAVTAAAAPDGRILIASRSAGGSDVVLHLGFGDVWTGTLLPLEGGVLAPAVAIGPDGAVAVATDDGTGVPAVLLLSLSDLEHDGFARLDLPWSRGDVVVVKRPAIAFGSDGALRLWATGADGEVHSAESRPGAGPPTTWGPAR